MGGLLGIPPTSAAGGPHAENVSGTGLEGNLPGELLLNPVAYEDILADGSWLSPSRAGGPALSSLRKQGDGAVCHEVAPFVVRPVRP